MGEARFNEVALVGRATAAGDAQVIQRLRSEPDRSEKTTEEDPSGRRSAPDETKRVPKRK
jgi:hypothetical protein